MGVQKFRSVEEMPDHPPRLRTPLEGLQSACELSEVSSRFGAPSRVLRGVRKFRSHDEAIDYRRHLEAGRIG